jgi:hypothetical protein
MKKFLLLSISLITVKLQYYVLQGIYVLPIFAAEIEIEQKSATLNDK